MRIVYLGTSEFGAAVLHRLAGSPHRPLLVVTPPDRRRGRGLRAGPPPAALAAEELGIELLQAADVNAPAALERIDALGPDAIAVCAFGQLIREPLLSRLLLNVHPSLLPRWRGAAPIERALMAGDARTGVSVMRIEAGLDSGPVALQEAVEIGPEEDFGALSARLAALGGELLVRALGLAEEGRLELRPQSDAEATYAEKIDPAERSLDPRRPAVELERRVRALTPHVGAHLECAGGARLGVSRARVVEAEIGVGELRADAEGLLLGCARGALRLDVVQPPGGRPMPATAYLRGHPPPALASR